MRPNPIFGTLAVMFLLSSMAFAQSSQPPIRILNPNSPDPPSEARLTQFDFEVTGASWRVFGVDSFPGGPVTIVQVGEVRQHNPPSKWSVSVLNRGLMPVNSLRLAAAIVDITGKVKATQRLVAIRNIAPGQVQRREMQVIATVLAPTDRVVFFVQEIISEMANWKAVEAEVAALIQVAAARLPVP